MQRLIESARGVAKAVKGNGNEHGIRFSDEDTEPWIVSKNIDQHVGERLPKSEFSTVFVAVNKITNVIFRTVGGDGEIEPQLATLAVHAAKIIIASIAIEGLAAAHTEGSIQG